MRWYTLVFLQVCNLLRSRRAQLALLGCLVLLCLLVLLTRTGSTLHAGPTLPWPWPT
jgi:hypothetical protein